MYQGKKRVFIETYGCQMNVADSEVILGLLAPEGYSPAPSIEEADVILVNTCSVRENAEQRVYGRLGKFKEIKKSRPGTIVGVVGCMAERLRSRLTGERAKGVGQIVDLIVGPDEYRKVPALLAGARQGERGIAVRLSRVETYDDIVPLRTDGVCAWISVMRGCDKFCSFCVVPFTRGRERSRTLDGVVEEVRALAERGFREVTLLGQNVNSYSDGGRTFADLLRETARVDPAIRVRFTTSHPQDMSDDLIDTIARHPNICKSIHLPVQSGSDRVLKAMNRTYDRRGYLRLVERIRAAIPGATLSTDIISGFPGETAGDHRMTLDLLEEVRYDGAYTFAYSPREGTPAYSMPDDVPDGVKNRRVGEVIAVQTRISNERNQALVGTTAEVLVEGESRRSPDQMQGRTDGNKMAVFPKGSCVAGEVVRIIIARVNAATLFGEPVAEQVAA